MPITERDYCPATRDEPDDRKPIGTCNKCDRQAYADDLGWGIVRGAKDERLFVCPTCRRLSR